MESRLRGMHCDLEIVTGAENLAHTGKLVTHRTVSAPYIMLQTELNWVPSLAFSPSQPAMSEDKHPIAPRVKDGHKKPHVGPTRDDYHRHHAMTIGHESDAFWAKVPFLPVMSSTGNIAN